MMTMIVSVKYSHIFEVLGGSGTKCSYIWKNEYTIQLEKWEHYYHFEKLALADCNK